VEDAAFRQRLFNFEQRLSGALAPLKDEERDKFVKYLDYFARATELVAKLGGEKDAEVKDTVAQLENARQDMLGRMEKLSKSGCDVVKTEFGKAPVKAGKQ